MSLGFYAVICGLLSLAAPLLGRPMVRITIGAVVGVMAAIALPLMRATLGYG